MNQINLSDRNAVVTGGARGIGYAISQRLLQSGARVCIWDVDTDAATEAVKELSEHGNVITQTVELTDADAVQAATDATLAELGSIDILCNNAGIAGGNYKTWEYPVEEFRRVIDVDLNSVFLCCRAVVPHMRERGWGRIINTASIAGKEGNPNASAYSAAKAGLISFTQTLAIEYGPMGIRSNVVLPGTVETPVWKHRVEARPEVFELVKSWYPVGRVGQPEDIASAVAFLCADEAGFVNGASLTVDGGLTAGSFRMIRDMIGK